MTANHPSSDIGELVRRTMRALVTDEVLLGFNRTGREGKKEVPSVLIRCLLRKYKYVTIGHLLKYGLEIKFNVMEYFFV